MLEDNNNNNNNNNNTIFKGVYTALITPFNKDGSIDKKALEDLVEWQIAKGVQGLVPAGTTGESPTLSHKEHFEVISTVIEQANKRVPVIAGTGSNSTEEAIMLSKQAYDLGATASLQVCPYYNKPSQEGLYRHFSTIAEAVALPQVLYNIPGRSGVAIELPTILKLLENPLIVGIKDATGNVINSMNIIAAKEGTKFANVSVLSGDDNIILASLAMGGHGVISVISNVIPAEMVELVNLALDHNFELARTLFYKLYPLFQIEFIETNPIPIKYMAAKFKLCQEIYRLPLCEPSASSKNKIDQTLIPFLQ